MLDGQKGRSLWEAPSEQMAGRAPRATKVTMWESKRNTIRRVEEMLVKSKVPPEGQQGARINARSVLEETSDKAPQSKGCNQPNTPAS